MSQFLPLRGTETNSIIIKNGDKTEDELEENEEAKSDHRVTRPSLPPIKEYEYFVGIGESQMSSCASSAGSGSDESSGSRSPESTGCSAVESLAGASHSVLAVEWSMLCQDCTDCWTLTGR